MRALPFPDEALAFVTYVFTADPLWLGREVRGCVAKIVAAKPSLVEDQRFIELDTTLRASGI